MGGSKVKKGSCRMGQPPGRANSGHGGAKTANQQVSLSTICFV